MKIGFTGTREGMSWQQQNEIGHLLESHFDWNDELVNQVHHGECIGADSDFHELARLGGWDIWGHPSDLATRNADLAGFTFQFEPSKPIERNHHIVDQTEFMVGAPKGLEYVRSGTWSAIRWARKRQRYIFIVYPNGAIQIEYPDGRVFFRGMWTTLGKIPELGLG